MPLIKCGECGREISSQAAACPGCGAPNIPTTNPAELEVANHLKAQSSAPSSSSTSYVDRNLLTGESVVFRTTLHWSKFFVQGFFATILLIGGLAFLAMGRQHPFLVYLGLGLLLVTVILVVAIWITATTSEFAVTNKRVLIKAGFIQRTSFELLLRQVESILVEQGVVGRMLGFGTLIVIGTGGSREEFDYISHPLEFRKQVQSQIASH